MKANYKIQFFTVIVNFFMALSLNSFISPDVFLSALFLYFISNLAAFWDKAWYYTYNGSRSEKRITYIGFGCCLFAVCFYLADALNFIDIVFFSSSSTYEILVQGIPNSFFTFSSINIKWAITALVISIPLLSLLLCIIPFFISHGYTKPILIEILKYNKKCCVFNIVLSMISGGLGVVFCHVKNTFHTEEFGSPQYIKYFFLCFTTVLCILFFLLIIIKKPVLPSAEKT